MGLGIASCGRERNSPPGDVPQTRTVRLFEDSAALAEFGESAAPVAMVALVLCFSFIYLNSLEPASISRVLSASLLRIRSDGGPSHLFAIVLIPTWMGASFLCSLESANLARVWSVLLRSALIAAVSGAIGVVYALVKSAQIVAASPIPSTAVDPLTAVHLESAYLSATSGFAWASLFVLAAWAWCLRGPADNAWVFATRMNVGISLGILTAAGATAWFGCVIPSYANSLAGWANIMVAAGNQAGGIHAYSRALSLDPRATAYRIPLAKLLADRAESKTVRELRETGMAAAEALLVEGGTISSLDRDTYYLGDFYLRWAGDEESRYERRAHAMAARRELEKSVRFEPGFEPAHVGLALADQMFLNDPKGAESEMKRADGLISPATAAASFEFYRKTSLESRSPELKGFRARRAFWCCATAVDYARSKSLPEFPLHLRCGILHEMVGDTAGAILELKMAASLTDRDTWVAESYLSQCYHLQGNSVAAIEHINRALDSAPPEARDNLEKLRQQYAALQ
jgi:tetratricopeptide (TPR) repeat protein